MYSSTICDQLAIRDYAEKCSCSEKPIFTGLSAFPDVSYFDRSDESLAPGSTDSVTYSGPPFRNLKVCACVRLPSRNAVVEYVFALPGSFLGRRCSVCGGPRPR